MSLAAVNKPAGGAVRAAGENRRRAQLAALEQQVRQVQGRHRPAHGRLHTGLSVLDAALGGGWVLGGTHELVEAAPGVGLQHFALSTACRALWQDEAAPAARERRPDRWVVQIDVAGTFYPLAALQAGIPLERLLIVRPPNQREALWAAEQLLRCRAVAAVLLPVQQLTPRVARRLQLAAEAGGGLGLLLRSGDVSGATFAASRVRISALIDETKNEAVDTDASACHEIRMRIAVLKLKEGRAGALLSLALPLAPHSASAPAPRRILNHTEERQAG